MKGERMKNRMRASDQVQLAQKNTLNDGPLLKRHQAVQAVAWDGPQGIYRLQNGLILTRDEIKRAEPELREQIMANSERGFEPGLVCADAGIWAEPVNHVHVDDTHNLITNTGTALVANMIQSFIAGTNSSAPANTPNGMVLGNASTPATPADTDNDITSKVYSRLYDSTSANNGVVTLTCNFTAPSPAISNISQVAQMIVTAGGQPGTVSGSTASSIINLGSTINLSTSTSLDVTVTWTVSDSA